MTFETDTDACINPRLVDTFKGSAEVARKEAVAALELDNTPRVSEQIASVEGRYVNDGDGDGGGSCGEGHAPPFLSPFCRARRPVSGLALGRNGVFGKDSADQGVGLLLLVEDLAEGAPQLLGRELEDRGRMVG